MTSDHPTPTLRDDRHHAFESEATALARRYVEGMDNDPVIDEVAAAIYRATFHKGIESSTPQICRINAYQDALAALSAPRVRQALAQHEAIERRAAFYEEHYDDAGEGLSEIGRAMRERFFELRAVGSPVPTPVVEFDYCDECRDGCDVYECCVTGGGGRVVSWDYLCERHRDHQGFHDCHPGCCLACNGTGRVAPGSPVPESTP